MKIQKAEAKDWPEIHKILGEIVKKGDTYAISTDADDQTLQELWMEKPKACFVAVEGSQIAGSYYLKNNQEGGGSHVCNAGYIVHPEIRGKGIGRRMCEHSLNTSLEMGYKAMQYNLVVSTNHDAVHLWESMGFSIVGTLPGAFVHPDKGPVDAYIMYRNL